MPDNLTHDQKTDSASVLIISDDGELSHALTARWQLERDVPNFTVMGSDLCLEGLPKSFDVVFVGGVISKRQAAVIRVVQQSGKMAVILENEAETREAASHPRVLEIKRQDGWIETVVLLITEILKRRSLTERVQRLERENSAMQREATLGRYAMEMRHTFNNALTAALGNAELLLIGQDSLGELERSQLQTIRNMALRINEIMQRFSSLEKELTVVEHQTQNTRPAPKQADVAARPKARAARSGA
jgi:signal transduction histidine kinase